MGGSLDIQLHVVLLLVVLTIIVSSFNPFLYNVFALSPIFSRKVAMDDHPDPIDYHLDNANDLKGYTKYYNADYGFQIEYPSKWSQRESDDIKELTAKDRFVQLLSSESKNLHTVVGFTSPSQNPRDVFQGQVIINVVSSIEKADIVFLGKIALALNPLTNTTIVSKTNSTVLITYQNQHPYAPLEEEILMLKSGGIGCIFTYVARQEVFDHYLI